MPGFCLIPQQASAFLDAVKSGRFDASKLQKMSSAERHAEFADVLGESNAGPVNAAFESKLLLKNQQQGLVNWVKAMANVKPEAQRDLLSRVEKLDRVLEPKDVQSFLGDLAKQKLGFGVTMKEAGEITSLAKATSDAKGKAGFDPKTGEATGGKDARLEYGRALHDFGGYVADLKNAVPKPRTFGSAMKEGAGLSKALNSWGDNSALFRQGSNVFWTNNKVWRQNALTSWSDIYNTFRGKAVEREAMAEILSRPNAILGRYRRGKLALGNTEESFPTSLPEKVPGLGLAYKATENAFSLFQYRNRADVFDAVIQAAEDANVRPASWWNQHADVNAKAELESIGKMVNSLTARGDLGKLEGIADVVNNVFFSGRKMAGDFDVLTAHAFRKDVTPFVRKQAAINLAKIAAGTATVLATANMVNDDAATSDLTSPDAAKIKQGDTRIDITGGKGAMLILAARMAAKVIQRGSDMAGVESPVDGTKYDKADLISNFFENKLSPAARFAKTYWDGKDRDNKPPSLPNELSKLVLPLWKGNAEELAKAEHGASVLEGVILDAVGLGTNTYSANAPDLPKRATDAMKRLGIDVPKVPTSMTKGDNPHTRVKVELPDATRKALDAEFSKEAGPIIDALAANPDFVRASPAEQWEAIHAVITEVRRDQLAAVRDSIFPKKPK